eukprot:5893763-Prymnesium_polylepis.1
MAGLGTAPKGSVMSKHKGMFTQRNCRGALNMHASCVHQSGQWPMGHRVAVAGATRALRCRDWHE